MKKFSLRYIARSAVIAAMYFSLSMLFQPFTFGPIQLRISEALVMLPFIMSEGIVGIVIGCFLTNIFSPLAIYDMIFGTLATFIAALFTYKIKNIWIAGLPPIIVNALVLPLMWYFLGSSVSYWVSLAEITLSQTAVVYGLSIPLILLLKKTVPNLITNPNCLNQIKSDKNQN